MFDGGEIQVFAASFAVFVALLFLRRYTKNGVKDAGKHYPPSLPILPVLSAAKRGGLIAVSEHFMRMAEELEPIFSVKFGKRVVVINGYETIFDAVIKHSETFAHRGSLWVEDNILNCNRRGIIFAPYDDAYKKYHKSSLSILKEFGFGVDRVTETRILQEVEAFNEELLKLNGRQFDPKWPLTFATSKVVLSILFGKNFLQSFPNDFSTIVECSIEYFANIDLTIDVAPFLRFLPIFRKKSNSLQHLSQRLLNSIELGMNFNKSNNSEPTFVGRFLEMHGSEYNHQDLLYVLRDLCFGGTETVSAAMQYAIIDLANHPEVQTRFQREIDEVVPGERFPSLDDKPQLPYTEAVILEVSRRHLPGLFFPRRAPLKETKYREYDIPPGCMVLLNCYSAHMDQKFWKDPENFRPERFLDSESRIINSERLLNFGLGKRSCLGEILGRQNLFLFLTGLVQRFDIRPPEGQKSITVTDHIAFTTVPSHFEVRLIPRVKSTKG